MADFPALIENRTRETEGKEAVDLGEFIAAYSEVVDPVTKRVIAIKMEDFNFFEGEESEVREWEEGLEPNIKYIIHSHPFDLLCIPAEGPGQASGRTSSDTANFSLASDPMRIDEPSTVDRSEAGISFMASTGDSPADAKVEMLYQKGQFFHTHGHDLHFTRLDPKAKGVILHYDPEGGRERFDHLFAEPHPTPSSAFTEAARAKWMPEPSWWRRLVAVIKG